MFFQNVAFISPIFQQFLLKRMFLVSNEVVQIKSEAALLCVTVREHARAFVATI